MKNGCLLCNKILTIHSIFSEATHLDEQFLQLYEKQTAYYLGGGLEWVEN